MSPKPIYLIGFMSSGKSKLGRKLADQLNCSFIDLDEQIEADEGRSIKEIFTTEGEEYFRKVENEQLRRLPSDQRAVIALGGGTPCSDSNINYIKETGEAVYLKIDPKILVGRLRQERDQRPLTQGKSDEEISVIVGSLLEKREFYYLQATHILEDNNPSVKKLIQLLEPS